MRVWTKAVWQWINGVLVELPEEGESYWYDGPVAQAGSGTPVSRITHYRGRSDTGAVDDVPTWIANEDTAFSVTVGTNFRLRIGVENTGTASDTAVTPSNVTSPRSGIRRCGYADNTFTAHSNVLNGADAGSSADATNVTVQRLTSGTGSFATGTGGYDESEAISCTVANGNFTEVEFGLVFTGGASTIGVGGGESWALCVSGLTDEPLNTPTFTTPETNGSDFQHGNQLGGATQAVANSANISFTTEAAARNGNLVVVHVACDNNGTTDADHSEISGVTFNGVAMTKAKEFTNGQGAAQAGCTSSLWYLQISGGDVAAGATCTATFTTATTSGDANAIQGREFVVASGKTVAIEASATAATDAAQPGALDAATSNIECLRVRAVGMESSASTPQNNIRATNNTWSLWWTSGALARSATGCTSLVEANISTGTGASSEVTYVTSDNASVYVAFRADGAANTLILLGASTL